MPKINRFIQQNLISGLKNVPVVALLGPRQVGKTPLALETANQVNQGKVKYLNLKLDADLNKLSDSESYLRRHEGQLLIIDEVQRNPELFKVRRGLSDVRKKGRERKPGNFCY